jgi:hypothetical protein
MRLNYAKAIAFLCILNLIVCVTSSICKVVVENYNQNYVLALNISIFLAMAYNAFHWSKKVNQQRTEMLRMLLDAHERHMNELDDAWRFHVPEQQMKFSQKVNWKKEGF